jgi:predicted metal-binding protein
MKKNDLDRFVEMAVKLGAKEAKVIRADSVVTAEWVRWKCQYGGGGFGERLTCPPFSPTPSQTKSLLACYKKAILVHGDDHSDATEIVAKLEREIFLAGCHKAFALGSGPCRLCENCTRAPEECRHPEMARPAMEACGIDVFATVRKNGSPIEVVRNEDCEQNYYGLVLVE